MKTRVEEPEYAQASAGRILSLAVPALGVLVATPLYLLLDTAVVGRLGAFELAALAAGTTIQSLVTTQLTFLSYGTTARAARWYGAGDRPAAVREGVQSTWVALLVGLALAAIVITFAPGITSWLAKSPEIGAESTRWLRVAACGIPLILMVMAGNGWLRGVQDTRSPLLFTLAGVIPGAMAIPFFVGQWGILGSAIANLMGASISSLCFVIKLARSHQGSWAPHWPTIKCQLVLGRDLILRSLSFQITFLAAAAVAARAGQAALGAHQIMLQLWNFISLVLDSLGIAAQALVGAALGGGTVAVARRVGRQVTGWATVFAGGLCLIMALGYRVIPSLFSQDASVLYEMSRPWWLLVIMILGGGTVFALDGVLLGAADARYLRTISIISALGGFLPCVLLSFVFSIGLVGIWCGLVVFILIRLIAVTWRFRSMRWARAGVARESSSASEGPRGADTPAPQKS
ncbi:MATE family efflux transporter [Corynebacterium uropygiale]|uniref:MATE family efflux transporter n=1 Tax=Corynebacterium uropygiale TaxID=1775911 RepID=A0A9X1QQL7_9CORY|nr:MATE family efflux transporter [Corynebacterium uropygiale]